MDEKKLRTLRTQVIDLLIKRQAHASYEDAVAGFPMKRINDKLPNVEYSFWHLLEHIRSSQEDILEFIVNPKYEEKDWPADYWPPRGQKADAKMWNATIKATIKDRDEIVKIMKKEDLFKKIPWGDGQILLREAFVVADHNAYHLGAFIIARKSLKIWK